MKALPTTIHGKLASSPFNLSSIALKRMRKHTVEMHVLVYYASLAITLEHLSVSIFLRK